MKNSSKSMISITLLNCAIQGCNLAREHARDYGMGSSALVCLSQATALHWCATAYRLESPPPTGSLKVHWVSLGTPPPPAFVWTHWSLGPVMWFSSVAAPWRLAKQRPKDEYTSAPAPSILLTRRVVCLRRQPRRRRPLAKPCTPTEEASQQQQQPGRQEPLPHDLTVIDRGRPGSHSGRPREAFRPPLHRSTSRRHSSSRDRSPSRCRPGKKPCHH